MVGGDFDEMQDATREKCTYKTNGIKCRRAQIDDLSFKVIAIFGTISKF